VFDLLTPVVKGWCTEHSTSIASIGVQIHGGMGFVEETGAAQYMRDARITSIYEGTTGIQANDLVGRKLAFEKGVTAKGLIAAMRAFDAELAAVADHPGLTVMRKALSDGVNALDAATDWLLATFPTNPKAAVAGAVPYLELWGTVAGGWQMVRAALISKRHLDAGTADHDFYRAKMATARFYADHILPLAPAHAHTVMHGSISTLALNEAHF
jgi:acyl-CoA dehydrogenase